MMASTTNAIRLIRQAGIPLREASYDYDEKDLSGMKAASAIGMPPEQVFKTLVTRGARTGIHIFCIPVCCELDLKKAAAAIGDRNVEMVAMNELLGLTGYIRGGCSPVGMKKKYPVMIDEICAVFEEIAVSAGERGHQMILSPSDLIRYLDAKTADITK